MSRVSHWAAGSLWCSRQGDLGRKSSQQQAQVLGVEPGPLTTWWWPLGLSAPLEGNNHVAPAPYSASGPREGLGEEEEMGRRSGW